MTLQQLRIFVMLQQLRTVSSVADSLNLSQPTVSFHLRTLERLSGVPLFVPGTRHFALTEAGLALLQYARRMVAMADEAVQTLDTFRTQRRDRLKIGASHIPATYLLPSVLRQFQAQHPDVMPSVVCDLAPSVVEKVLRGDIHLGVILALPWSETLLDGRLTIQTVARDELGLVARTDAPSHWRPWPLSEKELRTLPLIIHGEGSSSRQAAEGWLRRRNLTPMVQLELGSTEAIKQAVRHGLGMAILSRMAVSEEVRRGELVFIPLDEPPVREMKLITHANRAPGQAAADFASLLLLSVGEFAR